MLHGALRGPFARTRVSSVILPPAQDADVTTWIAAVVTNGGTVSAARRAVVDTFVGMEKAAGTWALTDDYWPLWGENAPQALTSLKQRRLATAVSSPSFLPDRGYAGDGVASYLNTNYIPSTHAVAMTGTNMRCASWEPENSASGQTFGASSGSNINLALIGRSGALLVGQLNHNNVNLTLPVPADSSGYSAVSRAGGGTTVNGYKNGVLLTPATAVTPGAVLINIPLYICARNVSGVASQLGTRRVSFVCVGAPLTNAQETAQYNNVLAWATAIGAHINDDADAVLWAQQVVVNGGTVSGLRLKTVSNFIIAEKAAGTWTLTDDYWPLWGENEIQALTSLKQRRLATVTAAPVFTADRGYQFNGTTNFVATGFVPSTHAVAMTGTNLRLAIYERTNTSDAVSAGATHTGIGGHWIVAKQTASTMGRCNNSANIIYTLPGADARGFTAVSRNGATLADHRAWKNGVELVYASGTMAYTSTLISHGYYIGCNNNTGVANFFSSNSVGFMCVGAALTTPQEAAQYANVQAWATAIGAQV